MLKDENTTTKEKQTEIPFPVSLRDWFAGQALAGLSSRYVCNIHRRAKEAYLYADAMMAEREKKGGV